MKFYSYYVNNDGFNAENFYRLIITRLSAGSSGKAATVNA
jgi:hypothetical protein